MRDLQRQGYDKASLVLQSYEPRGKRRHLIVGLLNMQFFFYCSLLSHRLRLCNWFFHNRR